MNEAQKQSISNQEDFIEFEDEEEESQEEIIGDNTDDLDSDAEDDPEGQNEDQEDGENSEAEQEDGDDEIEITIGKEKPDPEVVEAQTAPQWVKDLRRQHKEVVRENRRLADELNKLKNPQVQAEQIGPKPTLEDCGYDPDVFEQKLFDWKNKKDSVESQKRQAEEEQRAVQEDYKQRLEKYSSAKTELKASDFDDAEDVVKDTLSVTQQGILIQAAESPALVVLALGRNPKKAKEIAAIKDPIRCAAALVRLEAQLKVTTKKGTPAKPAPEKSVKGSGTLSAATDRTLENLRAEAEKTGDYTKVFKYKQSKKK